MEPKRQLIKKTEDYTIELCYFDDMPYVSFYSIETEDLFYTQDTTGVHFRCKSEYNLEDIKDLKTDMVVEFLLKDHRILLIRLQVSY